MTTNPATASAWSCRPRGGQHAHPIGRFAAPNSHGVRGFWLRFGVRHRDSSRHVGDVEDDWSNGRQEDKMKGKTKKGSASGHVSIGRSRSSRPNRQYLVDLDDAVREFCCRANPEMWLADGFAEAFIGVVEGQGTADRPVYDFEKVIEILMSRHGSKRDAQARSDAIDYFEYNMKGGVTDGDNAPLYLERFPRSLWMELVRGARADTGVARRRRVRRPGADHAVTKNRSSTRECA